MEDRSGMCLILFSVLLYLSSSEGKEKTSLIVLNEDNWTDMLEGEWLVKFYAPWCPACKALAPTWEKVAGWSADLDVKVAHIDVTENPGLSGRFMVTSLPTIYHVKDGQFRTYRGSRSETDFVSFIDDKKYADIDPVSWYTSPTSLHMGALGMFFKLSMSIRDVHNSMTSDYGIPVWGSYTIFAIATIIVGLLIGLLIVFLCDTFFPAKPPPRPEYRPKPQYDSVDQHRNSEDKDNGSDIVDDRPQAAAKSEAEKQQEAKEEDIEMENVENIEDAKTADDSNLDQSTTARKRKPRATVD